MKTREDIEAARAERRAKACASLAELGEGVGILEYDSNNSGGGWWLSDETWRKLEEAGWTIHWARPGGPYGAATRVYSEDPIGLVSPVGSAEEAEQHRYLRALAVSCAKAGTDPQSLLDEWKAITGENPADEGCTCCGPPHRFTWHAPDGGEVSPRTETVYIDHGFGS